MNEARGNMYDFVSHTYNAISGKCPHACSYCYVSVFYNKEHPQKEMHLSEKKLKEDLGNGRSIFVGSGFDMFAKEVPKEWIEKTLEHCRKFANTYLFQSKNPMRFSEFASLYPLDTVLCTTIETNRDTSNISKAPAIMERIIAMKKLKMYGFKTTITLEPLLDFDLDILFPLIADCQPNWVSIGADSKNQNLPEPSVEKIGQLIRELGRFTEVKLKPNLSRLYPEMKL